MISLIAVSAMALIFLHYKKRDEELARRAKGEYPESKWHEPQRDKPKPDDKDRR